MKTYRLKNKEIKDLPVLATGYKILRNDWTTKNGYDYKDKKGNVLNTIHKVDGNLKECEWGLHFSKKPQDCFNFYECIQWNKFAKVEAYGECVDTSDNKKSIASILKIVEIYSLDEFLNLIQENLQNTLVGKSNGLSESYGVNRSNGVNWSYGVNKSNGVNSSNGLSESYGVSESNGVNWSNGVSESYGVSESNGVNWSNGVNESYGVLKCKGISKSIFVYDKSGKLYLFNKKITEERFNEVSSKLGSFNWFPKFNNAEELKGNLEWYETNIPAIVSVDNKTAWSFMPKEMLDYLKSLPEFDQEVFDKVTGDVKND